MVRKNRNLEKRLAAYGSMSLALAAVSMPGAAQAGAVQWTANVTTTVNTPLYFDIQTGTFGAASHLNDFELLMSSAGVGRQAFLLAKPGKYDASTLNGNAFAITGSSVERLTPGVGSAGTNLTFGTAFGTLASNAVSPFGAWNPVPLEGDIGLSIVRSSQTYYGWADIVVNADYTITLKEFGSNTIAGASDFAGGGVPEPSSLALLTLGAAGIAAWRRKKSL